MLPAFLISMFWQEELSHLYQLCFKMGRDPTATSMSCLEIAVPGGYLMLPRRAPLGTLLEREGDLHCPEDQLPKQRFSGSFSCREEPSGLRQAGSDVPPWRGWLSQCRARPNTKRVLGGGIHNTGFGTFPKCTAKLSASITYREKEAFGPL